MEIKATDPFLKSAKPLSKKYKSFNQDYKELIKDLKKNPEMGVDLGDGFRKVRMAISSKGKGKSGGARVITFNTLLKEDKLYLLYIYDKSEHDNILMPVIREIAKELALL
ncbi:MAG: type II toxin-antitoxin system RelE/ParE family toxin [Muribaculaceae bacterium]|nr:type II toxin-antitoxin system RelE/ParE family toxin [Muribaculaceae bacterium]